MAQQGLLFGGGINPVIGIQGGDVADFDVQTAVLQAGNHGAVGNGMLEIGVCKNDESHAFSFVGNKTAILGGAYGRINNYPFE